MRVILSALIGAAVTFALFALMAFLISGGAKRYEEAASVGPIEIVMSKPDSNTKNIQRTPPPPPPPPKVPPKMQPVEPDVADANADGLSFNMPSIDVGGASVNIGSPGAMMKDGDATPIVRINPKYPPQAARDGTEGWVKLSFTIDTVGGVTDVKVIDAKPKRIFDREARRALKKWKYKPKYVDGKAVAQPGMTVQLDFKLEQG